ncbi:MAG: GNAT family N-acetyltransferase [Myxococcales bacterium]|nr:GNAT family N-acetyltransferase [Myxococcales bacterium]
MRLTSRSLIEHDLRSAAATLDAGFADYFVRVAFTTTTLLEMVRTDSVDLASSLAFFAGDEPVGVALIARRGWTSRLATMSMVASARRRGFGLQCIERLVADAQGRGERAMELEVIERNHPAIALYQRCGFTTVDRLISLSRPPSKCHSVSSFPVEVDVREVAAMVTSNAGDTLPWQLSGESIAQLGAPFRGYRLGDSWAVIGDPSSPVISIRALVTQRDARGRGHATALLQALTALHPDRAWRVSALCPERASRPFERAGWKRDELSQLRMRRDTTPPDHGPIEAQPSATTDPR